MNSSRPSVDVWARRRQLRVCEDARRKLGLRGQILAFTARNRSFFSRSQAIFLPPFWSPVICFRSLSAFVLMPQVAASTTLAVRPLGRMERGPHVRGAAVRALMTTRRRPFIHQQSPPRSELEAFRGSSGDAKPHTWQTSHLTLLPARSRNLDRPLSGADRGRRSGSGGNLSVFWFNRFRRAGEIRQCGDFEPSSSLMPPCAA